MDPAGRFIELLDQPSTELRLDLGAALIGSAFDQSASVEGVVDELDQLARRFDPTFDDLMRGLFTSGLLRGNSDDYGDPRNSFLHEVLGRRLGLPITLSIVAMEVGRRAGVEIDGIGLPGHFIVRDRESGRYGDPFMSGRIYEHDGVDAAWRRITHASEPLSPAMLLPTPPRSILLRMLNNLKATLLQRDEVLRLPALARLRSAFPEIAGERAEHARWMRHWN